MKYIVGVLLSSLLIGMIACGRSDEASPVVKRADVNFRDMKVFYGSADGAVEYVIATKDDPKYEKKNLDSLYSSLAGSKYLKGHTLRDSNKISFEILDDHITFVDEVKKLKILSSYFYSNDSLFVLQKETDPIFVAVREAGGNGYFRTKAIQRLMLKSLEEPIDRMSMLASGQIVSLESVLDSAGFANAAALKNAKDTIIWCNVKYIYR